MANNKLQIKRTTVSGRTPNTTNSGNSQYISTGELALNLADGKLYTSDGTTLIDLTPANGGSVNTAAQYTFTNTISFSNTITVANISANGTTGTAGQVLTSNGTIVYWSTPSSGSGSSVSVSDTAPVSPTNGALWYYTGTSELFVYYDDGTSSQWVTTAATYVPSAFSTLSVSGNASLANTTFSSNVTISNTRISANGSTGTAGQVLTSSGTGANVYWSTPSSGITTGKSIAMAIVFGG
jgi:hypothetical protein